MSILIANFNCEFCVKIKLLYIAFNILIFLLFSSFQIVYNSNKLLLYSVFLVILSVFSIFNILLINLNLKKMHYKVI